MQDQSAETGVDGLSIQPHCGLPATHQTEFAALIMWPRSFREAFCSKFGCPPEGYESRVFWQCLYRHALPLAGLIYPVSRNFFGEDFRAIKQLGLSRSPVEFRQEVEAFRYLNRTRAGILRGRLKIRVSGQRLVRLSQEMFPRT